MYRQYIFILVHVFYNDSADEFTAKPLQVSHYVLQLHVNILYFLLYRQMTDISRAETCNLIFLTLYIVLGHYLLVLLTN
jgi:hypothetical protein